jgi:hypothetical protein
VKLQALAELRFRLFRSCLPVADSSRKHDDYKRDSSNPHGLFPLDLCWLSSARPLFANPKRGNVREV